MKKHINNLTNNITNKAKNIYKETKETMGKVKTTIHAPIDNFKEIKHKNTQIKEIITKTDKKLESALLDINTKLKSFDMQKIQLVSKTIEEFDLLMQKV